MSGIAGIIYPDVFQLNHLLEPMLKALSHRGSGVRDTLIYKNVHLGSCGTKIIFNQKKNIALALDGNIHNRHELQRALKKEGYYFESESSVDVIIYAYQAWGEEFLERIDGDYAFVLLDYQKELLYLVRDRIGIKPLYWYHDQHNFLFASELKGLLATGVIPQTPALDACAAYLTMGFIPQDMTPIQSINKLLPGHFLRFSLKESKTIHPYWSYSTFFMHRNPENHEAAAEELGCLLQKAVANRLPQHDKIGCLISGGLGSASIAYYIQEEHPNPSAQGFSVGFQGYNDEDIQAASVAAKRLNLNHQIETIHPQTWLDEIVKIMWHLDEPLADLNVAATWRLAKLASETTHTVYSGMGSDELQAGHTRYIIQEESDSFFSKLKRLLRPVTARLIIPILNTFYPAKTYTLIKRMRTNPWQAAYLHQSELFDEKKIKQAAPSLVGLFDTEIFLQKFHNLSRITSLVSSFQYFDVKTRLADCYILQYERLMSAHGLDWRSPFLDKNIVEFLAGFPGPKDFGKKDSASFLKMIMRNVFPCEVVDRPKVTRTDFLKSWIEKTDLPEIFHLITQGALVEAGIISKPWLIRQVSSPQKRKEAFFDLWAILALEVWFRLFINSPVSFHPPEVSLKEFLTGA